MHPLLVAALAVIVVLDVVSGVLAFLAYLGLRRRLSAFEETTEEYIYISKQVLVVQQARIERLECAIRIEPGEDA